MLEDYLARPEGKTLEFKENTKNLHGIVKTVVAFANTAGGVIVIGVQDRTKEILGIADALQEEERLASAIADNVAPLLVPDIEIHSYGDKTVLLLHVPHAAGPYYFKSEGIDGGTYIRFGSTNRKADRETIASLKLFASNRTYDELPAMKGSLDWALIEKAFGWVQKRPSEKTCETMGILSSYAGKMSPTVGGVLLFGSDRTELLPDAIIRCALFAGASKEKILDQQDIKIGLPFAIHEIIAFIERNTRKESKIGKVFREDIPEYPPFAVREAVTNALLHTDYSMTGCHIQIAIFNDRIEFTNPGGLPFGQTLQKALSGFSRLRNRVLGRVFRELNLIEQWGSGLQRIFAVCERQGLRKPEIEELGNQFRLTLFSTHVAKPKLARWEAQLLQALREKGPLTPKEIAKLWKLTSRTVRKRLKMMLNEGSILRIATSPTDPRVSIIAKQRE
jgi:ATP-dependent DNA helicase RecG